MARKKLFIILLILFSPIAYYVGGKINLIFDTTITAQINIDRKQAISIATRFAQSKDLNVSDWGIYTRVLTNNDLFFYYKSKQNNEADLLRKITPTVNIVIMLVAPDHTQNIEVFLRNDGKVLGFNRKISELTPYSDPGEQKAKELAEATTRRILGEAGLPIPTTLPIKQSESSATSVRPYTTLVPISSSPEIESIITVEVRDGTVISEKFISEVKKDYVKQYLNPDSTFKTLWIVFFFITVAIIVLYGLFRFVQKLRQKELSTARIGIMMILVAISFSGYNLASDIAVYDMQKSANPQIVSDTFIYSQILMGYALLGMLIGLAYAGVESDIREAYQKQLTSLDAFLSGKIVSANFMQSFFIGLVAGGYSFLLGAVCFFPVYLKPTFGDDFVPIDIWMSNYPWLYQFVMIPIHTITTVVIGFLIPLSLFTRYVKVKKYSKQVTILISFLMLWYVSSPVYVSVRPWYAVYIQGLVFAITIIVMFYKFDLLAGAVAIASAGFAAFSLQLAWQPSSTLHYSAIGAIIAVLLFTTPAIFYAFRGKWYSAKEVQPIYASRQTDRMRMMAEVNAAREAQTRLMPVKLPENSMFSITTSHIPAYEVGGDFYDVYQIGPGILGILIAEGNGSGIGSALSIAFAKGFITPKVLNNPEAANDPAQLLRKLSDRISTEFSDDIDHPGLTFAVIDNNTNTIKYGRTTKQSSIVAMRNDKNIELNERSLNDSIIEGSGSIQSGDHILLFTKGVISNAPISNTISLLKDHSLDKALKKQFKSAERKGLDNDMTVVEVKI